jgi:hypothetical protein
MYSLIYCTYMKHSNVSAVHVYMHAYATVDLDVLLHSVSSLYLLEFLCVYLR